MARPKGSPNKIGAAIKDAFWATFTKMGGVEDLKKWATENNRNKTEFYRMLSKIMPVESHNTTEVTRRQDVRELTTEQLIEIAARAVAPADASDSENLVSH